MSAGKTYQELEERDHADDTKGMSDKGHCRTKDREGSVKHRSEEEREEELNEQHPGVPNDGTNRHNSNTNEGAGWLSPISIREGLDEHVCDDEENSHNDGEDDFRKDDCTPASPRNVTREFLGGVTKTFLLVTSNHRSGETTVTDP